MTTKIHRSVLVVYSADTMFDLVNDIAEYPKFLPGCVDAEILSRQDDRIEARLDLAKAGIRQSFVTENRLEEGRIIHLRLLSGPFSTLHGTWRFIPLEKNACKVTLDLEFQFSNKLFAITLGPLFNRMASSMVDAFCDRAKSLYG